MIPNTTLRLVSSSLITESAEFGISMNDTAHIMQILRDQLYSDKILAVLREYGSNAWDAHRDAGKSEVPIKVVLPTAMEPTLIIRDYGLGLSPDGVFKVYTQYGASTKRNSDNSVGMLGIGSKSGFAYSDSFTVTSYHGGSKRTYVAVLDASEKGRIDLLCEEPSEETGVEIKLAVRPEDIREFTQKAHGLFKYFAPRPDINTSLPKLPVAQATLKHGVIYEKEEAYYAERKWVAVMGCVSYNINLDQIKDSDSTAEGGAAEFLSNISGALYFGIGEVQISASREELKYSTETKLALVKKFNDLVEEYVRQTLDTILNGGFSMWEKRVRAQVLSRMHLPVPADCKELTAGSVSVKDKGSKLFQIVQNRVAVTSIRIEEDTRFILWDDRRSRAGFEGLSHKDYYVHAALKDDKGKSIKTSWPSIEADLEELCKKADIVGIPVRKLSTFSWSTPVRVGGRKINPKHRMKVFTYNPEGGYCKPWSDCWNAEERAPTDDDVFVIISGFKTLDFDLGRYHRDDTILARELGGVVPPIYGYKTTEKKPVEAKDCQGTYYPEWRKKFALSLLTQQVKDQFALWQWMQTVQQHKQYWRTAKLDKKTYEKLEKALGPTHLISILVKNNYDGLDYFKKFPNLTEALQVLASRIPEKMVKDTAAGKALETIYAKYPLLTLEDCSVADVWGSKSADWLQYITLIDKG